MVQTKREPLTGADSFRVGGWRVEPSACELARDGRVIRLRPKVMELLAAFARNPGEVLSKACLLDMVWSDVTVGDASLTVAVGELREALGDTPEGPTFIETIPRRGYRLIARVTGLPTGSVKPGGSRFWLVGPGNEIVLRQGENLLGRAPDVHVRIESPKVSRVHARVTVDGEIAVLEDLGSKNGTYLGGDKVDRPTPLEHGDELRLGQLAALLRVVVADTGSTVTEMSVGHEIDTIDDTSNDDRPPG